MYNTCSSSCSSATSRTGSSPSTVSRPPSSTPCSTTPPRTCSSCWARRKGSMRQRWPCWRRPTWPGWRRSWKRSRPSRRTRRNTKESTLKARRAPARRKRRKRPRRRRRTRTRPARTTSTLLRPNAKNSSENTRPSPPTSRSTRRSCSVAKRARRSWPTWEKSQWNWWTVQENVSSSRPRRNKSPTATWPTRTPTASPWSRVSPIRRRTRWSSSPSMATPSAPLTKMQWPRSRRLSYRPPRRTRRKAKRESDITQDTQIPLQYLIPMKNVLLLLALTSLAQSIRISSRRVTKKKDFIADDPCVHHVFDVPTLHLVHPCPPVPCPTVVYHHPVLSAPQVVHYPAPCVSPIMTPVLSAPLVHPYVPVVHHVTYPVAPVSALSTLAPTDIYNPASHVSTSFVYRRLKKVAKKAKKHNKMKK